MACVRGIADRRALLTDSACVETQSMKGTLDGEPFNGLAVETTKAKPCLVSKQRGV